MFLAAPRPLRFCVTSPAALQSAENGKSWPGKQRTKRTCKTSKGIRKDSQWLMPHQEAGALYLGSSFKRNVFTVPVFHDSRSHACGAFDPGGGESAIVTRESRNEYTEEEEDGIFWDVEVSGITRRFWIRQTHLIPDPMTVKSQDLKSVLHLVPGFSASTISMFGHG